MNRFSFGSQFLDTRANIVFIENFLRASETSLTSTYEDKKYRKILMIQQKPTTRAASLAQSLFARIKKMIKSFSAPSQTHTRASTRPAI